MVFLKVSIYIHISHKGNPRGAGNAIALLEFIDGKGTAHTRIAMAAEKDCTRNSLVLQIASKALKMLAKPCEITIHTDNKYIESCVSLGWIKRWQQDGWKKAGGKPLANLELWKDFYISMHMHKIIFVQYEERQEFNIVDKKEDYGQDR